MPIIKSAKKRVRVTRRASARNVRTKRSVRVSFKSFFAKPTSASVSEAQKALDTAVKKGVIHKNKAARQKKRLAAQAKAAGVSAGQRTAKASAKPATAKKTTSKKAPAKKPATKKAPAKKK